MRTTSALACFLVIIYAQISQSAMIVGTTSSAEEAYSTGYARITSVTSSPGWYTNQPASNNAPGCRFAISYQGSGGSALYRTDVKGSYAGRPNCLGLQLESLENPNDFILRLAGALTNFPIPIANGKPGFPGYLESTCAIEITLFYSHRTITYYTGGHGTLNCSYAPTPVSCAMSYIPDIDHGRKPAGTVVSHVTRRIDLTCSGSASVTVYAPATLRLSDGAREVQSRFYFDRPGVTSTIVNANPNGSTTLVSEINSIIENPGKYQASGVILASWD